MRYSPLWFLSAALFACGGETAPEPKAASTLAEVTISSTPPGATVLLDYATQGVTPAKLTLPLDGRERVIRLVREGYLPREYRFVAKAETLLELALTPEPTALAAPAPPAATTPDEPASLAARPEPEKAPAKSPKPQERGGLADQTMSWDPGPAKPPAPKPPSDGTMQWDPNLADPFKKKK